MLTMARTFPGLLALALLLGASSPGRTLGQAPKAAEDKTGIPIGTKAPRFQLKDQSGKERSLDDFVKNGKVALIFYRSASW
jgi:cytochrome oxidase Cu insertion factor (SCO1/SenC/PrrC family)